MILPIQKSGYKLQSIQSEITANGDQIVFILETVDPATNEVTERIRFFCEYEKLGTFTAKISEAAQIVKTLRGDKHGSGGTFPMAKIEQAGTAPIVDEQNVALEIHDHHGLTHRFWMTPNLARGLGQQMISTAKNQAAKSQSH